MSKQIFRLISIMLLLTSLNVWASFVYWSFGQDVGSSYYWRHGNGAGSGYFWKHGRGNGSKYFWENGKDPGSRHYWKYGKGPGSKYFWENGETASFGPIFTSLCRSGSINIAPCKLMFDNPINEMNPPSQMLNELVSPASCEAPLINLIPKSK